MFSKTHILKLMLGTSVFLLSGCADGALGLRGSPAWYVTASQKDIAAYEADGGSRRSRSASYSKSSERKQKTSVLSGNSGTSYQTIGNTVFGSDGTTHQQVGNTVFSSDGTTHQRVGNSVFSSDGTTHQQIGNTIFSSDGTTHQRIGNSVFSSDGTICQTIGSSTFCN